MFGSKWIYVSKGGPRKLVVADTKLRTAQFTVCQNFSLVENLISARLLVDPLE